MAKAKKAKKPAAKKAARKAAKPAKKAAARKAAPKRASAPRAAAPRAAKPEQPKWKMPHSQEVITNIVVRDAAAAIEFYKTALGAQELMRHPAPDGKGIWHAEIRIGDTVIALNDEIMPGPVTAAGPNHKATASFFVYVPDCDALFSRAVAAGGHAAMPPVDMFWGDRMGSIADPFGQVWMLATHQKDLTLDEMRKAGEEFAAKMAAQHPGAQAAPPVPAATPQT